MTYRQVKQCGALVPIIVPPMVCLIVLLAAIPASSQLSPGRKGYLPFWKRGEYGAALARLQVRLAAYPPKRIPAQMQFQHGELLFATGQVDDAIEAYQAAADRSPEPEYLLALAMAHRYRGQPVYYTSALRRARSLIRGRRWSFSVRPGNLVAVGRIHELMGENPKTLLNTYYRQVIDRFPDSPEVYTGAGELAYRYSGWAMAAKHFTKALELDGDHVEALAGLCETYRKSGDPRIEETMARFENLNPNHPRLLRLQVEALLETGETVEALAIVERGLEINPVDLHLLALKSAAHFLDDDEPEVKATAERVLKFNPAWSELHRVTGRVAARHYRFEEALDLQAAALELDPKDWKARSEYTLNLMRLGREDEGRDELEKAFDAHPYSVTLYNLLQLMDSLADFEVVQTEDFVLKLPKKEAPVLAEDALALLTEALTKWEAEYDVTIERPVLIEMFDRHDDFMVRSVGLPGSVGHLGICFGKVVTMDTPSVRPPGSTNWRLVLWHEFAHVITLQKTKNRMERWLAEGISGFEESRYSPAWHTQLDPNYAEIIAAESLPKIEEITNYFIKPKSGGHMMFGYFVSAEFVSFYVKTYGFGALPKALSLIREKRSTTNALVESAGVSLDTMNEAFSVYLEELLAPYDNLPKPKKEGGIVERLADLLPLGGDEEEESGMGHGARFPKALNRGREALKAGYVDAAEKAFLEAYELFPDYRGIDAPLRELARLYENEERTEDWVRVREQMVQWTPLELTSARKLTRYYEENESWAKASAAAELAMGIDPYDVDTRRSLVRCERALGEYDSALRHLAIVEHLDSARAPEHRLLRAELLNEAERPDEAHWTVVRLLEDFPHYWEAQRLLLKLVEAEPVPELESGVPAPWFIE